MSDLVRISPIDMTSTGDDVETGFKKDDMDIKNVYLILNKLRNWYRDATPPQSPNIGDVWRDTNTDPHSFKEWNGTEWALLPFDARYLAIEKMTDSTLSPKFDSATMNDLITKGPIIDVRAFKTDDIDYTDAIQAAINYAFGLNARAVIDLGGKTFTIDTPLIYPVGDNVTLQNGKLIAADTFPVGRFLIETGTGGVGVRGFSNENLIFDNFCLDANHRGGCLLLQKYNRVIASNMWLFHYSAEGIKTDVDGHELIIDKCFAGEYLWGEVGYDNPASFTGTGIYLNTNDNHIVNSVVFISKNGIKLNKAANSIRNTHIWTDKDNGYGIHITQNANQTVIDGLYLDSCKLLIENPWLATVKNSYFLISTTDAAFSFIVLKPTAAGTWVKGLNISDNIFANIQSTQVKAVDIDTTSGAIDDGNIYETKILDNTFSNVKPVATKAKKRLYQAAASEWTFDFTDVLTPFGIVWDSLYSLAPDNAGTFVMHKIKSMSGKTVTISTNQALSGVVSVEVDINRG